MSCPKNTTGGLAPAVAEWMQLLPGVGPNLASAGWNAAAINQNDVPVPAPVVQSRFVVTVSRETPDGAVSYSHYVVADE